MFLSNLVPDLWTVLKREGGVGLAAPQIGVGLAVAVVEWEGSRYELINPRIVAKEGAPFLVVERCLSFPDKAFAVKRFPSIKVELGTPRGSRLLRLEGPLAQIFQHEIDHLAGRVIADHGTVV